MKRGIKLNKISRAIGTFFLIVLFFCGLKTASYADKYDDIISSIIGDGGGSTITVPKGATTSQQGWVVYIIDGGGNIVSSPVAYKKTESNWGEVKKKNMSIHYGGSCEDFKTGYKWPDACVTNNFTSNYSAVKAYMKNNLGSTIEEIWGKTTAEMFGDQTTDYYFVMEPFYWHGLHTSSTTNCWTKAEFMNKVIADLCSAGCPEKEAKKKAEKAWNEFVAKYGPNPPKVGNKFTYIGEYFCGTVLGGARWIQSQPKDYFIGVDVCRRNYWPNDEKYDKTVGGVNPPTSSGKISDALLSNSSIGYGICAFWNRANGEPPKSGKSLYEIKNNNDLYDISIAIPTTEDVTNEVVAASFIADFRKEFVDEKKCTLGTNDTDYSKDKMKINYSYVKKEYKWVPGHYVLSEITGDANVKEFSEHDSMYFDKSTGTFDTVKANDDWNKIIKTADEYPGGTNEEVPQSPKNGKGWKYATDKSPADPTGQRKIEKVDEKMETDEYGSYSVYYYKEWEFGHWEEQPTETKKFPYAKDGSVTYGFNSLANVAYIKEAPSIGTWKDMNVENLAYNEDEQLNYNIDNLTLKPDFKVEMLIRDQGMFSNIDEEVSPSVYTARKKFDNNGKYYLFLKHTEVGIEVKQNQSKTLTFGGFNAPKEQQKAKTFKDFYTTEKLNEIFLSLESSLLNPIVKAMSKKSYARCDYLAIKDNLTGYNNTNYNDKKWKVLLGVKSDTDSKKYNVLSSVKALSGRTPQGDILCQAGDVDTAVKSEKTNGKYKYLSILSSIMSSCDMSRVYGMQTTTIPETTPNGMFPTGVKISYKKIFTKNTTLISHSAGKTRITGAADNIYLNSNDFPSSWGNHVLGWPEQRLALHQDTGGEGDGYYICVHSPVESPIEITFYDERPAIEETQLIYDSKDIKKSAYNIACKYQLRLDKKYYVRWDNDMWVALQWDNKTPPGYEDIFNKYVKAKFLQFPFSVVYDGKLYRVNESGSNKGYTDWIELSAPDDYRTAWNTGLSQKDIENYESSNHWEMTPFYIPTFSEEVGAFGDENIVVKAKVWANNVHDRMGGNHEEDIEEDENSDLTKYVALTDNVTAQSSGWIYDFTITGTYNIHEVYGKLNEGEAVPQYSFCENEQDVKVGTKNRIGQEVIRLAKNGKVLGTKDGYAKNAAGDKLITIPLAAGKTYTYTNPNVLNGDLLRQEKFAYSLKTIGDLSKKTDYVEIIPTYKFVTTKNKLLKLNEERQDFIYVDAQDDFSATGSLFYGYTYNDSLETLKDVTIAADSTKNKKPDIYEKFKYDVILKDKMFKDSYNGTLKTKKETSYTDNETWIQRTIDEGAALDEIKSVNNYLYTPQKGSYSISKIKIPYTCRLLSAEYDQLEINSKKSRSSSKLQTYNDLIAGFDKDSKSQTDFLHSMQQWYGEFRTPSKGRIINNTKEPYDSFQKWFKAKSPLSWYDGELFEPFDWGSCLIINFDIYAYRDGKPYLRYIGGGAPFAQDMWKTEGYSTETDDKRLLSSSGKTRLEEGDVVIVDWSSACSDQYEIGIFVID